MVGRNEVAKSADFALSTASNVINNKGSVSEDIRKKVLWAQDVFARFIDREQKFSIFGTNILFYK